MEYFGWCNYFGCVRRMDYLWWRNYFGYAGHFNYFRLITWLRPSHDLLPRQLRRT
jgi:hypothetical protein